MTKVVIAPGDYAELHKEVVRRVGATHGGTQRQCGDNRRLLGDRAADRRQ